MKLSFDIEPKCDIIALYIVLALFMSPLENATSGIVSTVFDYFDELGAVFFLCWAAVYGFRSRRKLDVIAGIYVAFLLWGCICSVLYSEQTLRAQVIDFVCCAKYMMALFGVYCVACNLPDKQHLKTRLYLYGRIITAVLFIYVAYSIIAGNFSTAVSLVGTHNVITTHIGIGLTVLILYAAPEGSHAKGWIVLDILIILGGMTTKSVVAALFVAFTVYICPLFKKNGMSVLYFVMGVLAVGLSADSLSTYYFSGNSARSRLTSGAIRIVRSKKIFGYGYAMYASSQAAYNYSPLYKAFGFAQYYGMTKSNPLYLMDVFWPIILGEFGLVGMALFCACLYLQFRLVLSMKDTDSNLFQAAMIILMYFCILSFASEAFFNPIAVPYAILLGLILEEADFDDKKEKIDRRQDHLITV